MKVNEANKKIIEEKKIFDEIAFNKTVQVQSEVVYDDICLRIEESAYKGYFTAEINMQIENPVIGPAYEIAKEKLIKEGFTFRDGEVHTTSVAKGQYVSYYKLLKIEVSGWKEEEDYYDRT